MLLKSCPKCQGDLYLRSDEFGKYRSCLQCGKSWEPDAGSVVPQAWEREAGEKLPVLHDGCLLSPSCFDCPLPECVFEQGLQHRALKGRR
jgi:hypothetical protein